MTRNGVKQPVFDKFSPDQIEAIKLERKSGAKLAILCFKYSISFKTLYKILKS